MLTTYKNLLLHGNEKQQNEVHDQNGPKHRNIEKLKKGAKHSNCGGFHGTVPE